MATALISLTISLTFSVAYIIFLLWNMQKNKRIKTSSILVDSELIIDGKSMSYYREKYSNPFIDSKLSLEYSRIIDEIQRQQENGQEIDKALLKKKRFLEKVAITDSYDGIRSMKDIAINEIRKS